MNEFRQTLSTVDIEDLALPFELATGRSGASATKQTMVTGLTKAFDRALEGCHENYLANVDIEQKMAVEEYRGSGYVYMNNALRTGQMSFELNGWRLQTELLANAPTTTIKDVQAFAKSPKAFVKKLYKQSDLYNVLIESLQESATASLERWNLLANMQRVVGNAPPRTKNTVLWRGERYMSAFHQPTKLVDKAKFVHAEAMKALKIGTTFTRPDFSSFSMSVAAASLFSGAGCCMYRLVLSKTEPALFMPSYSEPREYEVILPPGTKFKVDKVETVKSHVSSWASMKVYWIRTMASDTKSVTPRPSTRI
jgi:hypothetical protein